jgi:hypothetical protein
LGGVLVIAQLLHPMGKSTLTFLDRAFSSSPSLAVMVAFKASDQAAQLPLAVAPDIEWDRAVEEGPKFGNSGRRHLVKPWQSWIEVVPGLAPQRVGDRLRLVPTGIVEARCVDGEDIGHCRKRHVDR